MKKRFVSVLLVALTLLTMLPVTVMGSTVASGTCGGEGNGTNLTWMLDSEGTLTISGTGTMANYSTYKNTPAPWYACQNIGKVVINDGVTDIGNFAFSYCEDLTSITIPSSITEIGSGAFFHCSKLTGIDIPASVTFIGELAFVGCDKLAAITVASENQNYLTDNGILYDIGKENLIRCPVSFSGSYDIPNGITTICYDAFGSCTGLTAITMPNSVNKIDDGAFWECGNLTDVVIPSSVTSIGIQAFDGTPWWSNKTDDFVVINGILLKYQGKGQSITVPNNVTSIGDGAFLGCSQVTDVDIPSAVTRIGIQAFDGCTSLTSITIPNGASLIDDLAFTGCSKLAAITIPDSVTNIGDRAFSGCSSLESVTIPVSVTSIEWGAFKDCGNLRDVYYGGSKVDWQKINIDNSENANADLLNATIHTSDTPTPSGGCYVATCVYGSYDCPEVWTLRRFRDETLAKTWYGRAFIHTYYAISPTIVKWFGNTNWFKDMWRGTLDKMVENLNAKGVPNTAYDDIDW